MCEISQTPGLRALPKTRIARRNARDPIRLFAGTLRNRRLIGEGKVREKSIMRSEPTNPSKSGVSVG